jgi:hypothetical protein
VQCLLAAEKQRCQKSQADGNGGRVVRLLCYDLHTLALQQRLVLVSSVQNLSGR